MMPSNGNAPRVPDAAGQLVCLVHGSCQVVAVQPRIYDGEQKKDKDTGAPIWQLSVLHTDDEGGVELIKVNYPAQRKPAELVGKERKGGTQLKAMFWQMSSGRNGWSYSIDDSLVRQFS